MFYSKLNPRLLFNTIIPMLFWITFIQCEYESSSINFLALLSIGIIFHLFTIFYSKKYSNILIHLNYRLKYLCISFFYSFTIVIILLILSRSVEELMNYFIYLSPLLLCLIIIGNELITKYEKNITKITIIGNIYNFSNNDFTLLKNMNIEYSICENFNSYKHDEKTSLVVNNTSGALHIDTKQFKHKIIDINKFLESHLRKTTLNQINSQEANIVKYNLFCLFS